jgi:hypothetical protein
MKALLPVSLVLLALAGAAGVWFYPIRSDIASRPSPAVDASGRAVSARPLSSLSDEDRKETEALLQRVGELEARLDAHEIAMRNGLSEAMAEVDRSDATRNVEGTRISGVVKAAGGQTVSGQVEELMDETARKRMRAVLKGWIEGEVAMLKGMVGVAGTQEARFNQIVEDILAEENAEIAKGATEDNMLGWRDDVLKSARAKLRERTEPVLTAEQKGKAEAFYKGDDWWRAFRSGQK